MSKKKQNNQPVKYRNTDTYHIGIEIPFFPNLEGFNHGTQTGKNTRVARHQNACRSKNINITILYEGDKDRLNKENQVISHTLDSEYVKRVADRMNEIVDDIIAVPFLEWQNSLTYGALTEFQQATLSAFKNLGQGSNGLSLTEIIIYDRAYTAVRDQAIADVNEWYYNEAPRVPAAKSASSKKYAESTDEEKEVACKPLIEDFHPLCLDHLKPAKEYKNMSIQSISLSYHLHLRYPNAKIRVVVVADDKNDNKSLYIYMSAHKETFEMIECESDEEIQELYMNNTKDFDMIMGNPPYDRTLHAKILNEVLASNPKAQIVWLAPENLVTAGRGIINPTGDVGMLVKLRLMTENRLSGYMHWGKDFGGYTLPTIIGIYTFEPTNTDYTYEQAAEDIYATPEDKEINNCLERALKIKCTISGMCFSENLNKKNITQEIINSKLNECGLPSDNKFIQRSAGMLFCTNKEITQRTMSVSTYVRQSKVISFEDAAYARQIEKNINEPEYRWILNALSNNGRSVYKTMDQWPESFAACNFSEAAKKRLKERYEAAKAESSKKGNK